MTKINQEEYEFLKALDNKWEWIARDSKGDDGGNLFAYVMKPIKDRDTGGGLYGRGGFRSISNDLFQFIRWEDLEPYNVAELIEEYESEEAEVKSKQELIEKWELAIESAEFYGKGKEEELIGYMKDFVSDLKQIDEPEVLSQEFIDKYSVTRFHGFNPGLSKYIPVEKLQNLLVPKQELPAIPQWVADNIESKKRVGTRLNVAMSEFPEFKLEKELDIDEHECNEIYARAWIDGYTIKKEPEYNVKFKVKSSFGTVGIFLYKKGDEVLAGDNFEVYYPKEDEFRLTEQEIRGFQNGDVLFEHFAVKVEEEEDD